MNLDSHKIKTLNKLIAVNKRLSEEIEISDRKKELAEKIRICDELWTALARVNNINRQKEPLEYREALWFVANYKLDIEIIKIQLDL